MKGSNDACEVTSFDVTDDLKLARRVGPRSGPLGGGVAAVVLGALVSRKKKSDAWNRLGWFSYRFSGGAILATLASLDPLAVHQISWQSIEPPYLGCRRLYEIV